MADSNDVLAQLCPVWRKAKVRLRCNSPIRHGRGDQSAEPAGDEGLMNSMQAGRRRCARWVTARDPDQPPTMKGASPNIVNLIQGMMNPAKGTPAGERVPSRTDVFEIFWAVYEQLQPGMPRPAWTRSEHARRGGCDSSSV